MEREKQIRSRTQQKHDIESNWKKAVNFIPLSGEIVVYDDVKNIKIGDGKTKINDLDFFFSNSSFDDSLDELKNEVSHKLNNIANSEEYSYTAATEADLEIWLEGIFNQMEDYSFRNLCILCKEISDWPMMGTIHKKQHYATVDLTAQINGYHYIKIRNPIGGVNWRPIDKKSIEQQIRERAYKSDLENHTTSKTNPHGVTKTQVGLGNVNNTADMNKPVSHAMQKALDEKMNEGVLIYDGKNDTDETGLNNWLDNTVMPTMADNTIRNISIRCGQVIPWPALGTIHKHANVYATIDVTTQVHGKHYTKVKNNTWLATVCETDKLNAKADKAALDGKADKSALDSMVSEADLQAAVSSKMDSTPIRYIVNTEVWYPENYCHGPFENEVEKWLDYEILPFMENNTVRNVNIENDELYNDYMNGSISPSNFYGAGTLYKQDDNTVILNLISHPSGRHITKTKQGNIWNTRVITEVLFNNKLDRMTYVYESTTDTDESGLNKWLSNIIGNIYFNDKDFVEFVSIMTPAVAGGKRLVGTFYATNDYMSESYGHSILNSIVSLIDYSTGDQYFKHYRVYQGWENTVKVGSNSSSGGIEAYDYGYLNIGVEESITIENTMKFYIVRAHETPTLQSHDFIIPNTGWSTGLNHPFKFEEDIPIISYGVSAYPDNNGNITFTPYTNTHINRIIGYK